MALTVTGPNNWSGYSGQTAQFFVEPSDGTPPYTFQWYETTAGILAGETTEQISITVALADDGLSYYCIVNDEVGTPVQSDTATLSVSAKPQEVVLDTYLRNELDQWVLISGGGNTVNQIDDTTISLLTTWSSQKIVESLNQKLNISEYDPYKMKWISPYTAGDSMKISDVVLDDGWLMIANKETTDNAAPTTVGDPFFVYAGTMLDTTSPASQIIFGNRYTVDNGGYLSGYRVYVAAGNQYVVYSVVDPLGVPKIDQLITLTAETTGWRTFAIPPRFLTAGGVFDVLALVTEPAGTPTIETYSFDYQTPQNNAVPATGQIQHSRSQPDVMNVSYTDNGGGDITTFLQGLSVGDAIVGAGVRWTIQSSVDQGTYITFVVSPALNGSPTGVQDFDFETVIPTPIAYGYDLDWWPTSGYNVEGLLGIDIPYEDIVPNANAYGTDIYVQRAVVSDDWDLLAYTDGTSTSTELLTAREVSWVQESSQLIRRNTVTTIGAVWMELGRTTLPFDSAAAITYVLEGKRVDGWGVYYREARGVVENDAGTVIINATDIVIQTPNPQIESRAVISGNDIVIEVKGRLTEEWSWKSTVFFNEISE